MTTRIFKHQSSLAKKMALPGGRPVLSVLDAAQAVLETHRAAAMKSLQDNLTSLEQAYAARDRDQIYSRALAMLDIAGFFETGPLHPAAFSLCDISEPAGEHVWDWPSVEVHLRALRFILADDCRSTENSTVILEGLASVRSRPVRPSEDAAIV